MKRYWREALAVLFVLVLVSTAAIVVNFRADEPEEKQDTWREKIQVSGTVGRIPTISLSSAVSVASVKMSDLEVGMGREITEGSPLIVALWSFDGATGQALTDSGRGNVQVGLATAEDFDEVLLKGVVGKTEGSRVLFVRPVESGGRVSTEINVVDILHSAASGEVVEGKDSPLRVTITDTGPNIAHDAGNPPADLQVQMLIAGDGEQVGSNDNVLMQYVLANWEDSVVVDSTWWTGVPKAINIAEAMPGVRLALIDQRVGSRVAITIPPEMASGDSTVTMVVDIIATQAQGGTLTPSTTVKEEVTS
ncbi:MAG: peptidylprolyl isomerase [Actinomycetaceae bacterium]|nr:peptidylprolyl isomerase [Actinomycetaceae bacterium]